MNPTESARGGMESLSKANAIISALEDAGELTVGELAKRTSAPASSTHRLVRNLVGVGWVERGPRRGQYRLGLALLRCGGMLEDRIDIRAVALPELVALRDRTRSTALLHVPRAHRAVCIERVDGEEAISLQTRLGYPLPLHRGAAALTLLAFTPDAERDDVLETLANDPREGSVSRAVITRELDRVRGRGYATTDEGVTAGFAEVGAPVFNHRGELTAAVSISSLRSRILSDPDAAVDAVLVAARAVSRRLGLRAERP